VTSGDKSSSRPEKFCGTMSKIHKIKLTMDTPEYAKI
jgi:hypothetical protein